MSTFKKAKVVMLSTKQKTTIGDLGLSKHVLNFAKNNDWINIYNPIKQHLYINSDDKIKEGDWVLYKNPSSSRILVVKVSNINNDKFDYERSSLDIREIPIKWAKKIIATTDTSLKIPRKNSHPNSVWKLDGALLPQPSQQFIQKFVEEYNKGNVINDVLVEYETLGKYGNVLLAKSPLNNEFNSDMSIYSDYLKINPKDNTITIKKVKDSWNREEVVDLLIRAVGESHDWSSENNNIHSIGLIEKRFLNKWIEENL